MTPADETFLLTLAGLLRAGILADAVPAYARQDLRMPRSPRAKG